MEVQMTLAINFFKASNIVTTSYCDLNILYHAEIKKEEKKGRI